MTSRETPTCETGFWEPLHDGCPVCGPNGPCRDVEYEAVIRAHAEGKRFRRILLTVSALVLIAALADTHPKGGDVKQAPSLMSGAVPEGETPQ